jgi:DNA repair protein RadC
MPTRKRTTPAAPVTPRTRKAAVRSARVAVVATPEIAAYREALHAIGLTAAAADRVADAYVTPYALARATADELAALIPDVAARRKAAAMVAILTAAHEPRTPTSDSGMIARLLAEHGAHLGARERFHLVTLNVRLEPISVSCVGVGTLSEVTIHPRDVFRRAILDSAAFFVVAHNHPSGIAAPSAADDAITRRLREAGNLLGIPLVDHLILTPCHAVYSYVSHGRMPA